MRHAETSVSNTSLVTHSELACLLLVMNLFKHANEVSICIGECVYILLKGIDHVTNSNFQLPVGGASLGQASGSTHTRWDLRLCWSTIECSNIQALKDGLLYYASSGAPRPPLWSSGQSSWLQIQRSGFDFRRYQIF
jgi:hypothetical protein